MWVEESMLCSVEMWEEKFIKNHFWGAQKPNSN